MDLKGFDEALKNAKEISKIDLLKLFKGLAQKLRQVKQTIEKSGYHDKSL